MAIRQIFQRLRRAQRPLVRAVQKGILHPSLFLLYYVGFGLFRALMTVFARRTLFHRRRRRDPDTFWREAEGYDLDEARLSRQS